MKRKIFACLILTIVLLFVGCGNMKFIDTTWTFDYAYVELPNGGCIEGHVEEWQDFTGSDVVQVKVNGETILTHYSNVVLIQKAKK